MIETTNRDLLNKINALEAKVDRDNTRLEVKVDQINIRMEQALGVWLFLKILGSVAIGATILWNATKDWFLK